MNAQFSHLEDKCFWFQKNFRNFVPDYNFPNLRFKASEVSRVQKDFWKCAFFDCKFYICNLHLEDHFCPMYVRGEI